MLYGLYLSANGLVTQNMRADTIANNLANVNTAGFKKDYLSLRQRDPEALREGGMSPATQRHLLAIGGAVEGNRTHTAFTQGALQPTGNPLDLALKGEGLFKLTDGMGNNYYSRAGSFSLDANRFLVGQNGFFVTDEAGERIQLDGNRVEVDTTGRVMVDGEPGPQIGTFTVDIPDHLHKVGESLFEAQQAIIESPSTPEVHAGFLESSSVSAVREMTDLIQAHRAYEANARFIRIQDETLGKAVTQIAT